MFRRSAGNLFASVSGLRPIERSFVEVENLSLSCKLQTAYAELGFEAKSYALYSSDRLSQLFGRERLSQSTLH